MNFEKMSKEVYENILISVKIGQFKRKDFKYFNDELKIAALSYNPTLLERTVKDIGYTDEVVFACLKNTSNSNNTNPSVITNLKDRSYQNLKKSINMDGLVIEYLEESELDEELECLAINNNPRAYSKIKNPNNNHLVSYLKSEKYNDKYYVYGSTSNIIFDTVVKNGKPNKEVITTFLELFYCCNYVTNHKFFIEHFLGSDDIDIKRCLIRNNPDFIKLIDIDDIDKEIIALLKITRSDKLINTDYTDLLRVLEVDSFDKETERYAVAQHFLNYKHCVHLFPQEIIDIGIKNVNTSYSFERLITYIVDNIHKVSLSRTDIIDLINVGKKCNSRINNTELMVLINHYIPDYDDTIKYMLAVSGFFEIFIELYNDNKLSLDDIDTKNILNDYYKIMYPVEELYIVEFKHPLTDTEEYTIKIEYFRTKKFGLVFEHSKYCNLINEVDTNNNKYDESTEFKCIINYINNLEKHIHVTKSEFKRYKEYNEGHYETLIKKVANGNYSASEIKYFDTPMQLLCLNRDFNNIVHCAKPSIEVIKHAAKISNGYSISYLHFFANYLNQYPDIHDELVRLNCQLAALLNTVSFKTLIWAINQDPRLLKSISTLRYKDELILRIIREISINNINDLSYNEAFDNIYRSKKFNKELKELDEVSFAKISNDTYNQHADVFGTYHGKLLSHRLPNGTVMVKAGCWKGDISQFRLRCASVLDKETADKYYNLIKEFYKI